MKVQAIIQEKLQNVFKPALLEVINESHMHNVPPDSESHFKVVIVSDSLEGVSKVARHQQVYETLADELADGVHALAVHTYTLSEWHHKSAAPASPQCMGGSKS